MKLLVAACRPPELPADLAEIRRLLSEPLDWTTLVANSIRHGVTAPAFRCLLQYAGSELPPEIAEAARAHIDALGERNRAMTLELVTVLDALATAGIETIPLKGPLLGQIVYGDPAIRAFRDLDILVHPGDIDRTLAVLTALNYQRVPDITGLTVRQRASLDALSGQIVLVRRDALAPVEPHWALVPENLQLAIDYDGIWQRSRLTLFEGREVRVLAPEDLVLSIAIHGGKDEWSRLQSVCDLAIAILRFAGLDWQLVLASATRQRCLRMFLVGARLAEMLMAQVLPPPIADACVEKPEANRLANFATDRILTDEPAQKSIFELSRFRYRLHDLWRDRLRYAAATVLTPRRQHFGLAKLPDRLFLLYYPIKLVHDYLLLPAWLALKYIRAPAADRWKMKGAPRAP